LKKNKGKQKFSDASNFMMNIGSMDLFSMTELTLMQKKEFTMECTLLNYIRR
jgi:hypothetical protein